MSAAFDEPVVCPVQIGRDSQLDALRQVAASVTAGSGQVVLVAGEAGIGKSRLTREFVQRLRHDGWVVLQGNCFERDRVVPYGPVTELLRSALGSPPRPRFSRSLGSVPSTSPECSRSSGAWYRRILNRSGAILSRIGGACSR
ncbi:MAG: AAA family ATPase [Chloroflexota bacterium]|nr:AAA family ATPase [Chloroflexota bacterium]